MAKVSSEWEQLKSNSGRWEKKWEITSIIRKYAIGGLPRKMGSKNCILSLIIVIEHLVALIA